MAMSVPQFLLKIELFSTIRRKLPHPQMNTSYKAEGHLGSARPKFTVKNLFRGYYRQY